MAHRRAEDVVGTVELESRSTMAQHQGPMIADLAVGGIDAIEHEGCPRVEVGIDVVRGVAVESLGGEADAQQLLRLSPAVAPQPAGLAGARQVIFPGRRLHALVVPGGRRISMTWGRSGSKAVTQ